VAVTERHRPSARILREPVQLLAFGFGAGLSPWAPGTAGTLLALPAAWLMMDWPLAWRAAVVVAAVVCGVFICDASARRLGMHDYPGIVFDEIAAMLLVALVLPKHPVWFASAFILFRIFDILKPWPIRDLDHRLKGGIGIMLDDLMAALYAMACLKAVHYLLAMI
jgi:phosphatidylglycerophosphatase A